MAFPCARVLVLTASVSILSCCGSADPNQLSRGEAESLLAPLEQFTREYNTAPWRTDGFKTWWRLGGRANRDYMAVMSEDSSEEGITTIRPFKVRIAEITGIADGIGPAAGMKEIAFATESLIPSVLRPLAAWKWSGRALARRYDDGWRIEGAPRWAAMRDQPESTEEEKRAMAAYESSAEAKRKAAAGGGKLLRRYSNVAAGYGWGFATTWSGSSELLLTSTEVSTAGGSNRLWLGCLSDNIQTNETVVSLQPQGGVPECQKGLSGLRFSEAADVQDFLAALLDANTAWLKDYGGYFAHVSQGNLRAAGLTTAAHVERAVVIGIGETRTITAPSGGWSDDIAIPAAPQVVDWLADGPIEVRRSNGASIDRQRSGAMSAMPGQPATVQFKSAAGQSVRVTVKVCSAVNECPQ